MPKVSRDSATQGGEFGPVLDRSDQLEGFTVNFTSVREDFDATPLMKGSRKTAARARIGAMSSKAEQPFATPIASRSSRPATPSTRRSATSP